LSSRDEKATRLVLLAVNGRDRAVDLRLRLSNCGAAARVRRFVYRGEGDGLHSLDAPGTDASLAPHSITVVELNLASPGD
jgi:hypothetical protein